MTNRGVAIRRLHCPIRLSFQRCKVPDPATADGDHVFGEGWYLDDERNRSMTRRMCLLFALALLCPAIVSAQSRQAEPAMTGVWTGELNRDGADSATTVTLTLKSDTAGKVIGTVAGLPNPAEVKDGSYDAKTGTLKLSLG